MQTLPISDTSALTPTLTIWSDFQGNDVGSAAIDTMNRVGLAADAVVGLCVILAVFLAMQLAIRVWP